MFLRANGIVQHLTLDGADSAPPLVLIHSLGTSAAVWEAQARALCDRFRVIRPDLRGHGLTEVTPGPYSIAGLAADVLAALDALGIGRAHVAGLSIGGLVAQAIAHAAPTRVASLILCDTALVLPPAQLWRDRAAAVRTSGLASLADSVLARWMTPDGQGTAEAAGLRAMLLRTPPEGYAAAAEAIAAADLTAQTGTLTVPALVLVGDSDEATPPASAAALRDAIAGSTLEVIPHAAHLPTMERAAEVTDAIARFLQPAIAEA